MKNEPKVAFGLKRNMDKPKIVFLYESERPQNWKDGLWAALNILEKDFEILRCNMFNNPKGIDVDDPEKARFVQNAQMFLGWGSFNSKALEYMIYLKMKNKDSIKTGLCAGGTVVPPMYTEYLDVIFYETEYQEKQLEYFSNKYHAFGINTQIYYPRQQTKIWDYIGVGSLSGWKRWEYMSSKQGSKLVIGGYQTSELGGKESQKIVDFCIKNNIMVSNEVDPETLAVLYNSSKCCYIPAELHAGGERAVLEARACKIDVEIQGDNSKLKWLLTSSIFSEQYYAEQLKKGVLSVL